MADTHENARYVKDEMPVPIDKLTYTQHACFGLGFEVRQMRDTPAGKLELDKALARIEDELARIGRGEVGEKDLIG